MQRRLEGVSGLSQGLRQTLVHSDPHEKLRGPRQCHSGFCSFLLTGLPTALAPIFRCAVLPEQSCRCTAVTGESPDQKLLGFSFCLPSKVQIPYRGRRGPAGSGLLLPSQVFHSVPLSPLPGPLLRPSSPFLYMPSAFLCSRSHYSSSRNAGTSVGSHPRISSYGTPTRPSRPREKASSFTKL